MQPRRAILIAGVSISATVRGLGRPQIGWSSLANTELEKIRLHCRQSFRHFRHQIGDRWGCCVFGQRPSCIRFGKRPSVEPPTLSVDSNASRNCYRARRTSPFGLDSIRSFARRRCRYGCRRIADLDYTDPASRKQRNRHAMGIGGRSSDMLVALFESFRLKELQNDSQRNQRHRSLHMRHNSEHSQPEYPAA